MNILNRLKCFWYGHDVPEEWLTYENNLVEIPIPCNRCKPVLKRRSSDEKGQ